MVEVVEGVGVMVVVVVVGAVVVVYVVVAVATLLSSLIARRWVGLQTL